MTLSTKEYEKAKEVEQEIERVKIKVMQLEYNRKIANTLGVIDKIDLELSESNGLLYSLKGEFSSLVVDEDTAKGSSQECEKDDRDCRLKKSKKINELYVDAMSDAICKRGEELRRAQRETNEYLVDTISSGSFGGIKETDAEQSTDAIRHRYTDAPCGDIIEMKEFNGRLVILSKGYLYMINEKFELERIGFK